jgi:hypothetical protein
MGDPKRGMYGKFNVTRTDGTDAPGGKHDGCRYFILDLTHDPLAAAAALTYADAADASGFHALARDLRATVEHERHVRPTL